MSNVCENQAGLSALQIDKTKLIFTELKDHKMGITANQASFNFVQSKPVSLSPSLWESIPYLTLNSLITCCCHFTYEVDVIGQKFPGCYAS